jgi:uncharacterized membrane protein HdeD (DUF308 family)
MSNIASNPLIAGISEIRKSWAWFLALGLSFMLLGVVCILRDVTATLATVLFFGWMLLFSGVVALIHAFRTRTWSGFFLHLLSALLRGFTGYVLIRYPGAGATSLTLMLASFFIVGGIFRAIGAGMMQFPRWGWFLFSGIVSVALGIMLLVQLPISSIWFIGFAIGVDLVLDGASLVGFATAIHSLPMLTAHEAV